MTRAHLRRTAAATLEFAVVLPVFLLFLWGIFEFGRVLMVEHALQRAAAEAARTAVVPEATTQEALAAAEAVLAANGISGATIEFDPPDLADLSPGEQINVRVTVPAAQVRWLPFSSVLGNVTLEGEASMVKEGQVAFYKPPAMDKPGTENLPPPPDSQIGNHSSGKDNDNDKDKNNSSSSGKKGDKDEHKSKDKDKDKSKDKGKHESKDNNKSNDKPKDNHKDKGKHKHKDKDKHKDNDKDKDKNKDKEKDKDKKKSNNKNSDKGEKSPKHKGKEKDSKGTAGKDKSQGSSSNKAGNQSQGKSKGSAGSGSGWTFTDSALP